MVLKKYIVFGLLVAGALSSTTNYQESDYMAHYEKSVSEVFYEVVRCLELSKTTRSKKHLLLATYDARMSMKRADFWLRYLEPLVYKKINGPLPTEWEVEVFEKWEKPYRRTGAGLTLAEGHLGQELWSKDSLTWYFKQAAKSLSVFREDSLVQSVKTYDHFWYANRLHLLNLAAIYTTGFECSNTERVLPELLAMMRATTEIYEVYNISYSNKPLSEEYKLLYFKAIEYVAEIESYKDFNHFRFIRDFVNPLFALNQEHIRKYDPTSASFNDYSLSNDALSIFDKNLYIAHETTGPYRNVSSSDKQRLVDLGKMLFHDPILSGNNKRSCASCHNPNEGFSQNQQLTATHFDNKRNIDRNTPTLHHAYNNHLLTTDGRQIDAIEQIREVINNPQEMACSDQEVIAKVLKEKHYRKELKYLKKYTINSEIEVKNIYAALASYISAMEQYNSPFDEAMRGADNNPDMVAGFNLFMGKAQCATCHFVPVFNGVKPPYVGSEFEVIGVPADTSYSALSNDLGRGKIHPVSEMQNAFRTPSIRNSAKTAPYMHNGVFSTLEQVMEFYNNGGGEGHGLKVANQSLAADSLHLNQNEIRQIITFLEALNEHVESPRVHFIEFAKESVLGNRTFGGTY